MHTSIRRAAAEDAHLLAHIQSDWFRETFDRTCTTEDMEHFMTENYSYDQCMEDLRKPNSEIYLLMYRSIAVGFYATQWDTEVPSKEWAGVRSMEIKRFYVHPAFLGRGLGKRMMQHCLDAACGSYDLLYLSVWEYNVRAQVFYKHYGFMDSGLRNSFPIGDTPQWDLWYYLEMGRSTS